MSTFTGNLLLGRRAAMSLALAAAGTSTLVACSSSDADDDTVAGGSSSGGTLRIALDTSSGVLDPWQTDTPSDHIIFRQITETLTSIDPETGELRPWLAESWEANDDATSFRFTLRDGVHFSDGTALTADIVAANLDEAQSLETAVRGPSYLSGYTGTSVEDALNFTVEFSAPNASFLNHTASNFLGVLAQATLDRSADERASDGVVGTGPFVLSSVTANQEVVLTARDDYDSAPVWAGHTGRANVDEVVFSLVPESGSRLGLLTSGQVHVIQSIQAQDFSTAEGAGAEIAPVITPGIPLRLQVNSQADGLGDPAVRQALSRYIDRDSVNTVVFGGHAAASVGVLTSNVPGYQEYPELLTFDTAEGDRLLSEAGWAKNAEGNWEKDGSPLAFHITKASPYSASAPLLELVVQQFAEAGIASTFADYTGDFSVLTTEHAYDILFGNTTDLDGDVLRAQLSPLGGNRANLSADDPLTAPLEEQNTIGDAAARQEKLGTLQKTVIESYYQIPIIPLVQFYATNSAVDGLVYDVESRPHLYDATVSE